MERFNRKTFDPMGNPEHRNILSHLRKHGHARRYWYGGRGQGFTRHSERHYGCCVSPSLEALRLPENGSGIYLDLGCGDSADAVVASSWGYEGIGLDLFPPSSKQVEASDIARFIRADVAEEIPFPDGSVIAATSHAMIDLIEPEARARFYSEVYRVLVPDGRLSLTAISLANGYGVSIKEEKIRAEQAGLLYICAIGTGFVVSKASSPQEGVSK